MKKKAAIVVLLTVLCIAATVYLRFAVDRNDPEYTEVEVTVISSDTVIKRVLGERQTYYEVMVLYDGQTYELQNAHNSYSFTAGKRVNAFLSDGKLYANIEGVKTSTPLGTVYFAFLFGSVAMVVFSATYISKAMTSGV